MNKLIDLIPFAIVAMLGWIALGQFTEAKADERAAKHSYVYQVCNGSRVTINGNDEQECADAQDKAHVEFLCVERNQSPNTYCWTEDNNNLGDN